MKSNRLVKNILWITEKYLGSQEPQPNPSYKSEERTNLCHGEYEVGDQKLTLKIDSVLISCSLKVYPLEYCLLTVFKNELLPISEVGFC